MDLTEFEEEIKKLFERIYQSGKEEGEREMERKVMYWIAALCSKNGGRLSIGDDLIQSLPRDFKVSQFRDNETGSTVFILGSEETK